MDGDLDEAVAGQSVTLTLADEIDVSRGDVLAAADAPAEVADQFEATVVWMAEEPLLPGRALLLKIGDADGAGDGRRRSKYKVNVNTLEHSGGEDARAERDRRRAISSSTEPIAFDPYAENRDTGGFILIDRLTNATVGAGMLHFALRRAQNVHWQALDVDREPRARR